MALLHQRLASKKRPTYQHRSYVNKGNIPVQLAQGQRQRRTRTSSRRMLSILLLTLIAIIVLWWIMCFFHIVRNLKANNGTDSDSIEIAKVRNRNHRQWLVTLTQTSDSRDSSIYKQQDDDVHATVSQPQRNTKPAYESDATSINNEELQLLPKDPSINTDTDITIKEASNSANRPLTHDGEQNMLQAINQMFIQHQISEKRLVKHLQHMKHMRTWYQWWFEPAPEPRQKNLNLTFVERKQLNKSINEIIANHTRYVEPKKSKIYPDPKPLTKEGEEQIRANINRVNAHHSRKGTLDSCRGVYWNEITITIPGTSQGDGIDTHHQDELHARVEKIVENVSPYFPLMESERRTKRTVLILPNALSLAVGPGETTSSNDITLTTHMGVGKYKRFLVLIERWNGPASVAVKIRSLHELEEFHNFVADHIQQLRSISFHYYFEYAPELDTSYPQNTLRNLALYHTKTQYFLVNDVDIFPSPINTHDLIKETISSHPEMQHKMNQDTFYIIPMFDLNVMVLDDELTANHPSFPETKRDAMEMNRTGQISQHLMEKHPRGHRAVNYEKWLGDETDVAYSIEHENKFEPYVIGSFSMEHNDGKIPGFYPFYRGYGYDKYSWYAELEFAGFKLQVLRDFFLFHAKHESSYGDATMKNALFVLNKECSQEFIENVMNEYGPPSTESGGALWMEWMEETYIIDRKSEEVNVVAEGSEQHVDSH